MKRKVNCKATEDKPQPDAITDVLWSVLFKTTPQSTRRKRAVILVTLTILLASGLHQLWRSATPRQSPPSSTSPSISQEGGVHIGDNVIGDQITIEASGNGRGK